MDLAREDQVKITTAGLDLIDFLINSEVVSIHKCYNVYFVILKVDVNFQQLYNVKAWLIY